MRLSLKDHQSVNYVKVLNQLSNNYVHVCAALLYQAETETETNSAVWASHPDKNLSTSGVLSPQKPSLISLKLTLLIWVFEFKPQLFLFAHEAMARHLTTEKHARRTFHWSGKAGNTG